MRQTPTVRYAHCGEHVTHHGACARCQRASMAAAREQLALATPQTRLDLGAFVGARTAVRPVATGCVMNETSTHISEFGPTGRP
jgi:hypothetical protein